MFQQFGFFSLRLTTFQLRSLTEIENLEDPDEITLKKPTSVLSIKETININELFQCSEITSDKILSEINNLDSKRVGSYKNIPTKILKESSEISCEYLTKIWNEQVIMQKNFPNEVKLADNTPILKRDYTGKKFKDSTLAKNYRPVSVIP